MEDFISIEELQYSRFVDPTIDFAFKRIFGSERYKAATIGLLNSIITDHVIYDLEFVNVELEGESADSRKAFVDILCKDVDGCHFIVEMQNASQRYFRERMIYYSSKLIALQEKPGRHWNFKIKKTYSIAILNFGLEKLLKNDSVDYDDLKGRYMLHYRCHEVSSNEIMPNSAEYYFLSLKNFNKTEYELESNTDKWLYLLKESKFFAYIPEEFDNELPFRTYLMASERSGFTKEEEIKYLMDMMNDWDIENSKREAVEEGREEGFKRGLEEGKEQGILEGRKEGLKQGLEKGIKQGLKKGIAEGMEKGIEKGIEQGIEQGIEKGIEKGKLETARRFLELGVDIETIEKATGLSENEIKGA